MRKVRKWRDLSGIFLALGLVTTISTPALGILPNLLNLIGLNLIVGIEGKVWIKRDGSNTFQRAYQYTRLNLSDRLRLENGASVTVMCRNSKTWNIRNQGVFPVSQGCSQGGKNLARPDADFVSPRDPKDFNIPYLISPRHTNILEPKPTLRWNQVKGASNYTVEVYGGKNATWTKQVKQPSVVYDGKPLEPGWHYWVRITANGLSTRDKDTPRFTLLEKKDIQKIKGEVAQLEGQSLAPEAKTLVLAHLYRTNNLNSKAIELLEGLVKQGSQTTAVYRDLGFLYWKVGLYQLSKEQYVTALKLVEAEKNQEGKAEIQEILGKVSEGLGNSQEAFKWFEGARNSYVQLGGYNKRVEKLEQKLKVLQGRLG